jgi:hypothetical protein
LIISPQTFSAGQVLATTLADNNLVTVIGKPLGNKPTGQTGGSALNCPILRRLSRFPIYMERPDKSKMMKNHYFLMEIYNTFQDLLNGNNQVIEYILNEIKR